MNLDDQIDYGLGIIVANLGGNSWTDETVVSYRQQFSTISDGECFIRACQSVVDTWTQIAKPPPAVIREAYKAQIIRRELDRPTRELEESKDLPSWRRGYEIARKAYVEECERQGKEPRDGQPESMVGWCYEPSRGHSGMRRLT